MIGNECYMESSGRPQQDSSRDRAMCNKTSKQQAVPIQSGRYIVWRGLIYTTYLEYRDGTVVLYE